MNTNLKTIFTTLAYMLLVTTIGCSNDDELPLAAWELEINQVKEATSKYRDVNVAINEGFFDASGFVPDMGHHYILPQRIDNTFELESPEILLYVPDGSGTMEFVAIEYAVPVEDIENPGNPPEGFSGNQDVWHLNTDLKQWQLHVWIIRENPDGIFAAHNPTIGNGN